jgi:formylglycine-generating enzyme required for sulfatase activity
MGRVLNFFKCVGQAVVGQGLRALAGLMPFGEALWNIAEDAGKRLKQQQSDTEVRAEVEAVAQLPVDQAQKAAEVVVAEVAADQPPEVRVALTAYLSQLPAAVRQSLKRRDDPSGTTVPATFALNRPQDVLALLPAQLPRFRPGDRPAGIGEWQLLDLLGVGGFGEVWKARHVHFDGTLAAIKFCLDREVQRQLLEREGKVLNQVMRQGRHPGIVLLQDANLTSDPPWLRYEYIEGGDLAQVVRDCADETPAERVTRANRFIQQLAAIVGHFHRLNPSVVHRDLKPANVLIQPLPGGDYTLRVADFGIGDVAARRGLDSSRAPTARGDVLATVLRGAHTPLYASPQQKRGDDPDVRDDVYSLGVIWYQLLTGDLGSERPGGLEWAEELTEAGMSNECVRLLSRCVADRAEKRPADAAVLAEEIVKLTVTRPPPPARRPGDLFTNSVGMKFAWIPPGTFLMGSPANEEGRDDEEAQHRVTLTKGFFMGIHPVTQEQWQRVLGDTPSLFTGTANLPVESVSWDDCEELCRELREIDGKPYRLPTEAEWEYACRAGTTTAFHFGGTISTDQANYDGNYTYGRGKKGTYREKTTPVGRFPPNAWGLYDMHGNVWEWCADWYGPYEYEDLRDPQSCNNGDTRVMRGGSWPVEPLCCRAAYRNCDERTYRNCDVGCRLVFCLD